jgi:fructoselysine-6-P-deglycase FrlB-like protein
MDDLRRDISAQPQALRHHAARIEAAVETVRSLALAEATPVFTGMATSLYAWDAAALLLAGQRMIPPWVVDTAQLADYGISHRHNRRLLFVLSRSGASAEVVRLLEMVPPEQVVIGITEATESALSRRAQHVLRFEASEKAFSNTKSFTLSLAYSLACACGLGADPGVRVGQWIGEAAAAADEVIRDTTDGAAQIADMLARKTAVILVGRGYLTGIVQQAALDLQEAVHLPALPAPGGLFRHGTIELTARSDIGTVVLIPNDVRAGLGLGVAEELRSRGAPVAAIVGKGVIAPQGCPVLWVPDVRPELLSIVYAVALQCITATLADLLGLSEIKPLLVAKVTDQE